MHRTAAPRRATRSSGGTRSSGAETGLANRGTWLAITAIALLIAVIGVGLRARSGAAEIGSDTGTLGGLTVTLRGAGWVAMDGHNTGDQVGYQMPAQMMPGAPEGDDMRLGIPLTLINTDDDPRKFNLAEEFALGGGRNTAPRPLHSDTFGELARLTPGSAVHGFLYFDTVVPGDDDEPLYLLWQRDGQSLRLAIPLSGDTPDHDHGPA